MDTLLQSKPYLKAIGKRAYTTSTLEIPEELLDYFFKRTDFFGSRRAYLHHLICVYGRYLNRYKRYPFTHKWKKQYQREGQNLKRCDFVPNPSDWEELRHIGFAYGLSMCHLFVYLMKLEKSRWEKAGHPEKFVEHPPRKTPIRRSRARKRKRARNSVHGMSQKGALAKESLLNAANKTGLVRIIDLEERFLLRIGWIR